MFTRLTCDQHSAFFPCGLRAIPVVADPVVAALTVTVFSRAPSRPRYTLLHTVSGFQSIVAVRRQLTETGFDVEDVRQRWRGQLLDRVTAAQASQARVSRLESIAHS